MAWLLVGGEEPLPANNRLSDNWSADNSSNGNCLPLPNNTHTLWRGIDFSLTKFKMDITIVWATKMEAHAAGSLTSLTKAILTNTPWKLLARLSRRPFSNWQFVSLFSRVLFESTQSTAFQNQKSGPASWVPEKIWSRYPKILVPVAYYQINTPASH